MLWSRRLVVRAALLGVDEVRELLRVADEEDRRVVADEVVVALLGVELDREAARVALRCRRLPSSPATVENRISRSVLVPFWNRPALVNWLTSSVISKDAVGAAALGVHDALGHALAVELRHLLDQVVVLQQKRARWGRPMARTRHSARGCRRRSW